MAQEIPKTMQAVRVHNLVKDPRSRSDLESSLKVDDIPVPEPQDGEFLIKYGIELEISN